MYFFISFSTKVLPELWAIVIYNILKEKKNAFQTELNLSGSHIKTYRTSLVSNPFSSFTHVSMYANKQLTHATNLYKLYKT